jgi:hypothetical protein
VLRIFGVGSSVMNGLILILLIKNIYLEKLGVFLQDVAVANLIVLPIMVLIQTQLISLDGKFSKNVRKLIYIYLLFVPFVVRSEVCLMVIYYGGSSVINYFLLRNTEINKLAFFEIGKFLLVPLLCWNYEYFFVFSSTYVFIWFLSVNQKISTIEVLSPSYYRILLDVSISSVLVYLFNYIDQYSFSLILDGRELFGVVFFLKILTFMKLSVRKIVEFTSGKFDTLKENLIFFKNWCILIVSIVIVVFSVNWFFLSKLYPALAVFKNCNYLMLVVLTCISLVFSPVWFKCSISKGISIQRKHDILQIFSYALLPVLVSFLGLFGMVIILSVSLVITVVFYNYYSSDLNKILE